MVGAATPACVRNVGQGFYNMRGSLKLVGGLVDVGVHMSLVKLESGRFLVFDTIAVSPELKVGRSRVHSTHQDDKTGNGLTNCAMPPQAYIDQLTDGGELIEAVIGTHPYHTLFFRPFHTLYPKVRVTHSHISILIS
jgi:hypothetical protein